MEYKSTGAVDCNQCGQCCQIHYKDGTVEPCPCLLLEGTKTICGIYDQRIGKCFKQDGDLQYLCGWRLDTEYDFPGCPYNTDKPIVECGYDINEAVKKLQREKIKDFEGEDIHGDIL